jgi:hypothetical protein
VVAIRKVTGWLIGLAIVSAAAVAVELFTRANAFWTPDISIRICRTPEEGMCRLPGPTFAHFMFVPLYWWFPLPVFVISCIASGVMIRKTKFFDD